MLSHHASVFFWISRYLAQRLSDVSCHRFSILDLAASILPAISSKNDACLSQTDLRDSSKFSYSVASDFIFDEDCEILESVDLHNDHISEIRPERVIFISSIAYPKESDNAEATALLAFDTEETHPLSPDSIIAMRLGIHLSELLHGHSLVGDENHK